MVFDFAGRPPEINSALMYSGPGAGPMMAAAATWNNLAAELSTAAASYESVISELSGEWTGAASSAMAAAAAPYVEWMNNTAAAAGHAASQASASAAAYQTAFAMTVPPALIAANRAQLATLTATNVLGQNTAAIAANEAQYGEMWAQDAAAMYGYAGSSASAASLNPLTSPTATTNPTGAGTQTAAVSTASSQSQLSQLVSSMPLMMHGLASPAASSTGTTTASTTAVNNGILSGPDGFINDLISSGGNVGYLNDVFDISGSFNGYDGVLMSAFNSSGAAASAPAAGAAASVMPQGLAAGLGTATVGAVTPASAPSLGAAPMLAGVGQASTVGKMSVPMSWAAAAPEPSAAPLTAADWNADYDDGGGVTNVATGMPATASTGRGGHGFRTPRYGVKPTVMPTQVLV